MLDLYTLPKILSQLLEVETIDSHISRQKPVSATYRWQGREKPERFLLALNVTSQNIKIQNLWVPASKQRKGIGSAIIDAVSEVLQHYNLNVLLIEPRPGSEPFWQKVGFVPLETDSNLWVKSIVNGETE